MIHKQSWVATLFKRLSAASTSQPEKQARFIFEEMEPRKLFSADPLGGLLEVDDFELPPVEMLVIDPAGESTTNYSKNSSDSIPANSLSALNTELDIRHELVFIDSAAENYDQLIDDLSSQGDDSRIFSVFVLDSDSNGIDQITEELQNYEDIDALHIISHGTPGAVSLGNTQLNSNNLNDYAAQISLWQNAFDQDADILIYGCELVGNEAGENLTAELSALTGTDVAASVNDTGSTAKGGDWELEFSTGVIETKIAISEQTQQSWEGLLAFETYRDQFDTVSFINSDGSQDWSSNPWQEIGESDLAGAGQVLVSPGFGDQGLSIYGSGDKGVFREVDLSGATNASLSFDYAAIGLDDVSREVFLEVSGDGGGTWAELEHWVGPLDAAAPIFASYDISASIASNTQIRFRTVGFQDNSDKFYFDNFQITYASELSATSEFLINQTATDVQETSAENRGSQQAVSLAADGSYVVTWSSVNQDGSGWGVYARRFDSTGTAISNEIRVNQTTTDNQQWARVASDAAGNFVVTWTSSNQDSTPQSVYARRFQANGAALDNEFRVNQTISGTQTNSTIAMDSSGNFIISWEGNGPTDSDGIFFKRFNADGTELDTTDQLANVTDRGLETNAAIALSSMGQFYITWTVGNDLYFEIFNSDGSSHNIDKRIDASFTTSSHPAIAADDAGNFTVVYRNDSTDHNGIWGRRFDKVGAVIDSWYFNVSPSNNDHIAPSISMDPQGNFIVTYQGSGDGQGSGVFARRYDFDLNPLDSGVLVNQTVSGEQTMVSVSMIDTDNYVVVWSGAGVGDTSGVFTRQFGTFVNAAPIITSQLAPIINENTSFVQVLTATDGDGDVVSFSISGGNDAALFEIDIFNELHFISAPDFESPTDSDLDGIYNVEITADDGKGGVDVQTVSVTINDDPLDTNFSGSATAIWSENGLSTVQTANFNGIDFADESNTDNIGGPWAVITGAESPTRDEKIVIGVDTAGNLSGQLWDGLSWTAFTFNDFATVTDPTKWGFAVAYESQSGNAVMVWNNGSTGIGGLSYRIWDGTNWSATTIMTAPLVGEAQQIKLASAPDSNNMVLIVSTENKHDFAVVWDGTNWGNSITLTTDPGVDNTDISVIYEQQSGDAIVIYGSGLTDLKYRVWDGFTWSAESTISAPAGVTASTIWTSVAADPNNDRVVLGAISNNNETWLSVWDGDVWETSQLATTGETTSDFLGVAVAFEGESGDALAVYTEDSHNPRFRTWNSIAGWSAQADVTILGNKVRSLSLVSRPETNQIMLASLDAGSDAQFVSWDGHTWGDRHVLETNTGQTRTQPLLFLWDQNPATPASEATFLFSTKDDVTGQGGVGLNAWTEGEVLELGNPSLQLEPVAGETTGTLLPNFNLDMFGDGDTGVDSIHYVNKNIQIGSSNFDLFKGDLLISTETNENLPGLTVAKEDVFIFRPDSPGDYSSGTFLMLLNNPVGTNIQGITLVEQDTLIGDYIVQAGDFLMVTGSKEILLWETTNVGAGALTSGTSSILINGNDNNIGINKNFKSIDLIENTTIIGGYTLSSGTLVVTVDKNADVGSNNINVDKWDLFALNVSQTTLTAGAGNGSATAILIVQGSDIGLSAGKEVLFAVTTATLNNSPTADANAGAPYVINEGDSITLDGSNSSDPDLDTLTFSWDLNNDLVYGDVVGETPLVAWATLQSNGINDDGVYTIGLKVEDGRGEVHTTTTTITVNNVAPVLSTTGSSTAALEGVYTLNLSVVDPGADTITGWTINWGDGAIESFAGNPTTVTHTYTNEGFTNNILASATDEDGTYLQNGLLVADFTNTGGIFHYSETGEFLKVVGAVDLNKSIAVIVGPDGNWYGTGEASGNVYRYNTDGGTSKVIMSGFGEADGLAFDSEGNLFVASWAQNKVYKLTHNTSDDSYTQTEIVADTTFNRPYGLVFDPNGDLYVSSYADHNVQRLMLNADGSFTASVFISDGLGGLNSPEQMAFGPDGKLYLTSAGSHEVLRYNPEHAGTPQAMEVIATLPSGGKPEGIAFGPDGNLYISDHDFGDIIRFNLVVNGGSGELEVQGGGETFIDGVNSTLTKPVFMAFLPEQQVEVININQTPVIADQTFSLPENSLDGVTVDTVTATDPDAGDTLSFSITAGNDLGGFAISSAGVITVADSSQLDFETTPTFSLTVQVMDDGTGTLSSTATISINLSPVNELPVIVNQTFSLPENSLNGTTVGTVMATDPDVGDTLSYSITAGNGLGGFAISSAGVITVLDSHQLDFETNPTFNLTVQAMDDGTGTLSSTATISINLNPVNELPVIADQLFSLPENSLNGATVGTVMATDPDVGDTLSFSITAGNDLGGFAISSAGAITVLDSHQLDFETNPTFNLTVQAMDDGTGTLSSTATISINLSPVNELPVIANQTFSLPENSLNGATVGTVMATDPDVGDTLSYSITAGNGLGGFAISSAGVITVLDSHQLDFETNPTFNLTVQAMDDGTGTLSSTATISINLSPVNELPVIANQTFSLPENSLNGTTVGTVMATDPDVGDILSFSITAGNGLGGFAISSAGVITVVDSNQLDFETNPTFNLTVQAMDDGTGTLSSTATVSINLNPVNELPVIADQLFSLPENSLNGTTVGTVMATDPDVGDTLSYSITAGNGLGGFAISSAGVITVVDSNQLDFETNPTFNLTVQAMDDGTGTLSSSATVSINLSSVNEVAVIADQTFALPENSLNGVTIGTVMATDPDAGDNLSYTFTAGNELNAFAMNSAGVITVADSSQLDFEVTPSFTLTVQVTDDGTGTLSNTATITVNLTDGNENPVMTNQSFSLPENSLNGVTVGTVTATDPDGDNLSYSITAGNGSNAFSIDNATGAITVADSNQLDFETTPGFSLTVQVVDSGVVTLNDTATINIDLIDIDEIPNSISLSNNIIDEHVDARVGVTIGKMTSSDENAHGYQVIGGADQNKFSIGGEGNNELILIHGIIDFENQSSYQVIVGAIDSNGDSHEETFRIIVKNLNEKPVITSESSITHAENISSVSTVVAEDQNQPEQTLSYSLTGGADSALFSIDSNTGELSFKAAPDFEKPVDSSGDNVYLIEITVNDGNGGAFTQSLSIEIENAAEAPDLSDQSVSLDEQTNVGSLVSTLAASDPDQNESFSYKIIGGDLATAFTIDNTDQLIVSNQESLINLDNPVVSLVIQVTDSQGLTDTSTIQINVQALQKVDVNVPVVDVVLEPESDQESEVEGEIKNDEQFAFSILENTDLNHAANDQATSNDNRSEPVSQSKSEDNVSQGGSGITEQSNVMINAAENIDNRIGDVLISTMKEHIENLRGEESRAANNSWVSDSILIKTKAIFEFSKIIPQFSYIEINSKVLNYMIEESGFSESLDSLREQIQENTYFEKTVVGSSVTVTTGLSIGYVIWLVRGGVLLSSVLSSLPAWRMIDPLPVITSLGDSTADEDNNDSLASLIKKGAETAKVKLKPSSSPVD